ncbi:hypothetical protein [Pleomorphomonas carboxyditropha]|uniref:Uncharacterized protein n=1 Tax=Pleomorphomonas carboxyditropha TaxID=2023338 RepID=A0A2G9WV65_9HYPH|nr:hypothetical protein [Pleomorphomonas carboxyditropha]PIO98608.1 hypothetical protein CJ014_14925 [Pleomorphomonas carboxyditropha]
MMGAPKATLGYESRTAAIAALRANGLSTAVIADRIGIEAKTVTALEASATRAKRPSQLPITVPSLGRSVLVPFQDYAALRPHAARRAVTVDQLIRDIVEIVARDDMVDAVLDDGAAS